MVAAESRCGTGRVGSYPIRRYSILSRAPKGDDPAVPGPRSGAERRPLLRPAALLEHDRPPRSGFRPVLHSVPAVRVAVRLHNIGLSQCGPRCEDLLVFLLVLAKPKWKTM